MHRFFIENTNLNEFSCTITGSDFNHIKNVLRLKKEDKIKLFDGRGFEYLAEIEEIDSQQVTLKILQREKTSKESPIQITAAQAYLKDNKMDTTIRHLTELGITKWIPFFSERVVPKLDAKKIDKKMERWEKIAKESLKQCERNVMLQIERPKTFAEVLSLSAQNDLNIIFWEGETEGLKTIPKDIAPKRILIVLGPEGGFPKKEIGLAKENSFSTISLGPRILKADTAIIAAVSIVQHLFGDM